MYTLFYRVKPAACVQRSAPMTPTVLCVILWSIVATWLLIISLVTSGRYTQPMISLALWSTLWKVLPTLWEPTSTVIVTFNTTGCLRPLVCARSTFGISAVSTLCTLCFPSVSLLGLLTKALSLVGMILVSPLFVVSVVVVWPLKLSSNTSWCKVLPKTCSCLNGTSCGLSTRRSLILLPLVTLPSSRKTWSNAMFKALLLPLKLRKSSSTRRTLMLVPRRPPIPTRLSLTKRMPRPLKLVKR